MRVDWLAVREVERSLRGDGAGERGRCRRRAIGQPSILDRLGAEHRTVHALLERIRAIVRSVASAPTREQLFDLREVYGVFERVVISHFGYEERELEEAIGYYDAL